MLNINLFYLWINNKFVKKNNKTLVIFFQKKVLTIKFNFFNIALLLIKIYLDYFVLNYIIFKQKINITIFFIILILAY